jgi:hypothetical protein
MTEYMKRGEYDTYLALGVKFEECLIACAQEISMLSSGREMVGEFNGDTDICEADNKYLVQFETWSCCEIDTDSIYVPQEYIYDSGYREYYKIYVVQKRKEEEEMRLRREEDRKSRTRRIRFDERAEYERLKFIYGDE